MEKSYSLHFAVFIMPTEITVIIVLITVVFNDGSGKKKNTIAFNIFLALYAVDMNKVIIFTPSN